MFSAHAYRDGLAFVGTGAIAAWLWSVLRKDVSGVDSLWSLTFMLLAGIYALDAAALTGHAVLSRCDKTLTGDLLEPTRCNGC